MSTSTPEPTTKQGRLASLGRGNMMWVIAAVLALLAGAGALTILGNAAATTTYYVLARDVPARTTITPDMLRPVETSVGGAPQNTYDVAYVRDHDVSTIVALHAGDTLSASTVAARKPITTTLPDTFVAASFQVPAEDAVGGKVSTGDYIDLIATDTTAVSPVAKVVLHHVLVLDVTVAPDTIAEAATGTSAASVDDTEPRNGSTQAPGPESEAVRTGIPAVYTVGLSSIDATKLALIRGKDLLVVLSSAKVSENLDVQAHAGDVFAPGPVKDSGAGTQSSADEPTTEDPAAPSAATQ